MERELVERGPGWWERVARLVPEFRSLEGVRQPSRFHGEGDVAIHTRLAVEACPTGADPELLWAALLHDLGKPETTRIDGDAVTAHGHAKAGAVIADAVLRRLGMPEERRERVVWAVKHHTFHLSWNLGRQEDASRRHRRFVAHPDFPLLLELLRADSVASHGHPRGLDAYRFYLALHRDVQNSAAQRAPVAQKGA